MPSPNTTSRSDATVTRSVSPASSTPSVKATGTPGFLEDTGRMTTGEAGRPAALFRLAGAARPAAGQPARAVLNPPLMRPRD
jgi:hypothetical protein